MIDIKDFLVNILKDKIDPDIQLYTGRQDESQEKSLLISNDNKQAKLEMYNQNFFKQNITITVYWNDNYTDTRNNVLSIYETIKNIDKVIYDDNTIIVRCLMTDDFPKDNYGKSKIYSQKIDFQIHYMIFE